MNDKENKTLLNFICEAGLLKKVKRSGWWVVGIKNPESVAEHSFRCAVIGYVIAKMEKANPYEVLLMTLFGDIHEARINDLHKMAQAYMDYEAVEDKAFNEQIKILPKNISQELLAMHKDYRRQNTLESIIARDADILECLIQAREYKEQGFLQAAKFMQKAPQHLKTKTAKRLWTKAREMNISDWWMKLSSFKR